MSKEFASLELVMKEMLTKPVVGPEFIDSKSPISVSAPVIVPTARLTQIASKGKVPMERTRLYSVQPRMMEAVYGRLTQVTVQNLTYLQG